MAMCDTATLPIGRRSPFEFLLLFGASLHDHHVDVLVEDDGARHKQLIGVRLHLELLSRVRQVRHSGTHAGVAMSER